MISADGFGGTRPAGNDPIGQFYITAPPVLQGMTQR